MKRIAEAKKEPSIEDISEYLGIPVDVLERTRKTVRSEVSTLEYWQEWFSLTLEKSSEAKKANRDFRQTAASLDEVDCADSTDSDKESDSEEASVTVDEAAVEQEVCANIVVPLEDVVSTVTVELPSPVRPDQRVIRGATMIEIAREAVYRMLKEAKDDVAETENASKNVEAVSAR
ncbi:hypothetical protein PI124_g520 [Phytophthora idaei]|nr:hypothetical protein PI126_g16942 [Phytophthora idaei]KAG3254892.1 hypothetical protein PI124_g520 [Phytophthora idaei]